MSIFSEQLALLMKKNDMSDEVLGNLVNVNRTTVSRWRTGERSPKMEKLPEIASVFNVDPRIFVGELPNNDISIIYSQLNPARQEVVYTVAEQQLEEQNKVIAFPSQEDKVVEDDFAAHLIDPDRDVSEAEIEAMKIYLKKATEEYYKKLDK